jgi:nucleoside-triphosphatase THEP1
MTRWALISDEQTQTRTACISEMVARLRRARVSVGGFIQRRTDDDKGFELVHLLDDRECIALAQKPAISGVLVDDAACDYVFEEAAFRTARHWIEEDSRTCDLIVLDVISKMETYGHGHGASLKAALALAADKVVLIGVRASQLDAIVSVFALDLDSVVSWLELPVSATDRERFVHDVALACRRQWGA